MTTGTEVQRKYRNNNTKNRKELLFRKKIVESPPYFIMGNYQKTKDKKMVCEIDLGFEMWGMSKNKMTNVQEGEGGESNNL